MDELKRFFLQLQRHGRSSRRDKRLHKQGYCPAPDSKLPLRVETCMSCMTLDRVRNETLDLDNCFIVCHTYFEAASMSDTLDSHDALAGNDLLSLPNLASNIAGTITGASEILEHLKE